MNPPNAPFSDSYLAQVKALLDQGLGYREVGEQLGTSKDSVFRAAKRLAEKGQLGYAPVLPGYALKQITTKTADGSFIKQTKEAGPVFEMPQGLKLKGVTALLDAEGRVMHQHVMGRADAQHTEAVVQSLKEVFDEYEGPALLPPSEDRQGARETSCLSVYPIADQHVGLLSWGRETGEDYDLDIGAARLRELSSRLVSQSPKSTTALILVLGDWQHTDDQSNMTPGHHNQLDADSRYYKILKTGQRMLIDLIDLATQKHDEVIVRVLPGNHDPHASTAVSLALAAWYRNTMAVKVVEDPSTFYFKRWGVTLLGATHGHTLKPQDMMMNLAAHPDWSSTTNHWFLYGHFHKKMVDEIGGCRVECFQTITGRDGWSAGQGHLNSRGLTSVTLHKTDGRIGCCEVNLPPIMRRAA